MFEEILKEKQYHPQEGPFIPKNRLLGQFHPAQTDKIREAILNQICIRYHGLAVSFTFAVMSANPTVLVILNLHLQQLQQQPWKKLLLAMTLSATRSLRI